jgi:hypothetical protein
VLLLDRIIRGHIIVLFDLFKHPLHIGVRHRKLLLNFILSAHILTNNGLMLFLVVGTLISLMLASHGSLMSPAVNLLLRVVPLVRL